MGKRFYRVIPSDVLRRAAEASERYEQADAALLATWAEYAVTEAGYLKMLRAWRKARKEAEQATLDVLVWAD